MGWFSLKCPQCGGPVEATGYSAPYPAYRCKSCIASAARELELAALRERVARLEKDTPNGQ